ncbi:DUF4920 domain-containing protein [Chiayiivirga flava]|uniref:DUF4920 domain-containing protein n=1 Tax=Chiayiivirga flava TaxID=659595 RepID=A0A7W8D3B9_9GAMM|nr:DUF4920 domain-containing protein [Chiayiivirga flava]MBB5207176.1 hypothetical protein [Chiayiivirga flava]
MSKRLMLALLLAAPLAHAADDPETFGAAMPDGEAVPLDAALAAFDPAQTAPRKFSGRIVDVCEKRGCWAKLEVDGQSARVMPREHDFMVPRDVRGPAVVYGTLMSADLGEAAAEYAKDNPGKPNPVPAQEYRIDALSVVLLEQDG